MQILSVQTGRVRDLPRARGTIRTGIDKRPVEEITVHSDGVAEDAIVSTQHHGGPGQAVYLYARRDYEFFEEELGAGPFPPGTFGENVTVDVWPHSDIRIGDRFDFDDASLEVSAPRVPCATFAARMAEVLGPELATGWVKRFTAARRPGWYARVLQPGVLRPGQTAISTPADPEMLTGMQLWDLYHSPAADPTMVARALAAPIADRAREAWTVR